MGSPKAKGKRGRPTGSNNVFTPEKKVEFLGALKVAGFISVACDYIGISERGLRSAASRDEQFRADIEKALAARKMLSLQRIAKAQAWQAHAWWLERTDPANFGKKVALEHSGPDGGPIQQQVTTTREDFAGVALEDLLAMRDKAKEKLKAVDESNRLAGHNLN